MALTNIIISALLNCCVLMAVYSLYFVFEDFHHVHDVAPQKVKEFPDRTKRLHAGVASTHPAWESVFVSVFSAPVLSPAPLIFCCVSACPSFGRLYTWTRAKTDPAGQPASQPASRLNITSPPAAKYRSLLRTVPRSCHGPRCRRRRISGSRARGEGVPLKNILSRKRRNSRVCSVASTAVCVCLNAL